MCGIAGVAFTDRKVPDKSLLKKMADIIWHRGPDDEGYHVAEGIGLAHRRLSIIDLSLTGRQPMFLPDKSLVIVFNGEIYNYRELRSDLEKEGVRFYSTSDTEVILWSYKSWGLQCFSRFNGMWALAMWDEVKKELILSRDRFGVKPLYYADTGTCIVFASEAKAIFESGYLPAEVDNEWMFQYVHVGYMDTGEETFFKGIRQFSPAHYAIWQEGEFRKKERYWSFEPDRVLKSYDYKNPVNQYLELMRSAVQLRLRSDVPVGSCLSGGLDSSALVCLATEMFDKGNKMFTFSCIYEEAEFNEKPFVDAVVDYCDTDAAYVYPCAQEAMDYTFLGMYAAERPCTGPTIISQLNVMQLAHHKVKVLIDGQGGDELLAGYSPYFLHFLNSLKGRVRREFSVRNIKVYINALLSIMNSMEGKPYAFNHMNSLVGNSPFIGALKRKAALIARTFSFKKPQLNMPPLTHPAFIEKMKDSTIPIPAFDNPFDDELNNVLYNQFFRQSIPTLLIVEDANSMIFSIESRTPFMDYRLVEFMFGLDINWKIKNAITKYIHRQALDQILPPKVRDRKDKKGYPTPFSLWLRGPLKEEVKEVLFSRKLEERKIFDRKAIEHYWNMHQSGKGDFSWIIYKVLSTEVWYRLFIDRTLEPPLKNQRKNSSIPH
ncbi:MAG: asparagine synthase (glutamine-hydrolyzing) [Vulcanimicrobiota bacterium]